MDSFFASLERLELIAFFAGYPLVYALVLFIAGKPATRGPFKKRLAHVLPYAYALVGTLYWGYELKNWYPDYNPVQIFSGLYYPWLKIWALLSILFWIPFFSRKALFSLLHSFPFFFLLIQDISRHLFSGSSDYDLIRNDMKVYSDSLLLHFFSAFALAGIYYLYLRYRNRKSTSS